MTQSLAKSCQQARAGSLSVSSQSDVYQLLSGEGTKRLESFIFELLMQRALNHFCMSMTVALGWYVVHRRGAVAGLWIRLVTDGDLGDCDGALIALLVSRGTSILKVRPSAADLGFIGCWHTGNGWEVETNLVDLLQAKFKHPGRVREPKHAASDDRAQEICGELFKRMTHAEMRALALSRLLINCYIVPYMQSQPNDIDAVVLNNHDALMFVEFKRKYPASNDTFGLDSGHSALVRWLNITGHTLSNIILVDPCWKSDIRRLHLLSDPAKAHLLWVGAHIAPSFFEKQGLRTAGADSGMNEGEREQEAIGVYRFVYLGRGFAPSHLRAFLDRDAALRSTSISELKRANRAAARDHACP